MVRETGTRICCAFLGKALPAQGRRKEGRSCWLHMGQETPEQLQSPTPQWDISNSRFLTPNKNLREKPSLEKLSQGGVTAGKRLEKTGIAPGQSQGWAQSGFIQVIPAGCDSRGAPWALPWVIGTCCFHHAEIKDIKGSWPTSQALNPKYCPAWHRGALLPKGSLGQGMIPPGKDRQCC